MAFQKQQLNARLVNDLKKWSTSGVIFYMLIPGSDMTRDAFLTRADNVLYEAKESGQNRTVVDTQ